MEYHIASETEIPVLWQDGVSRVNGTRYELRWTTVYARSLRAARAIQRAYIAENGKPNP